MPKIQKGGNRNFLGEEVSGRLGRENGNLSLKKGKAKDFGKGSELAKLCGRP